MQPALKQQRELTERGAAFQQPYIYGGGIGMERLMKGVLSGELSPEQFRYGAEQPQYSYEGEPLSDIGYEGAPVDRSIASYMQEDPSLDRQQEQMEKMINRQAAAQGRWGGGSTAREMMRETAGLLSQDYANRFARAQAERAADVQAERERYGRGLTAFDIARGAEQEGYGRGLTSYDIAREREGTGYQRALGEYGLEAGRLADMRNTLAGIAGMGQGSANVLTGAFSGLGSSTVQSAMEEAQGAAAAKAANQEQFGNLLQSGLALLGGI